MATRKTSEDMSINIVEDTETYALSIERLDGQTLQLFEVTFVLEKLQRLTLHVLAGDEESAQAQAECYTTSNDIVWHDVTAVRVPLMIRGWGKETF